MAQRAAVDRYKGPYVEGIDVSRYQGKVDYIKVKAAGAEFVIVRTGDGKTEDPTAVQNLRAAKAAGLLVGTYHYFRADRDGATQARLVRHVVDQAGVDLDLPPALDFEEGAAKDLPGGIMDVPGDGDLPLDVVGAEALEHLQHLEKEFDMRPLVYTGQAFHWWYSQARPKIAEKFAPYPLWTPYYASRPKLPVDRTGKKGFPWSQWTIWQYTGKGTIDGVKGKVDRNKFRGDRAALDAFVRASRLC